MYRDQMRRYAATMIAAAALLALPGTSQIAQEQKPPALPLPEMQRLSKLYVGTWSYSETYPKSKFLPNGGVNTGVYTSELGPGGNSIINRFHSQGPVGDFEGLLVMTWDPGEKAYKEYVFSGDSPVPLVETGQWEGDVLIYRAEIPLGARKMALRNASRFLEGGKLVSDQFSSMNGAPETLFVHVEAVKK